MSTAPRHDQPLGPEPTTHEQLMDAALDHLETSGALGGINLSEIAERVGVTPANIYHYFGSRRGLLRAALHRETERLAGPLEDFSALPFAQRRLAVFDWVLTHPTIRLGALLALDDDPDFEPLPFAPVSLESYAELATGRTDVDWIAVHLLTLGTSVGIAIYLESVARQLGQDPDALVGRVRDVLGRMLELLTAEPPKH